MSWPSLALLCPSRNLSSCPNGACHEMCHSSLCLCGSFISLVCLSLFLTLGGVLLLSLLFSFRILRAFCGLPTLSFIFCSLSQFPICFIPSHAFPPPSFLLYLPLLTLLSSSHLLHLSISSLLLPEVCSIHMRKCCINLLVMCFTSSLPKPEMPAKPSRSFQT